MKQLILIFAISFLTLACRMQESDNGDSYVNKDTSEINERIRLAYKGGEIWVKDPLLLAHKLFRPDYLLQQKNTYKTELTFDSADNYTVTVLQEGYLDQPLYGIKARLHLKWIGGYWTVVTMKEGYKCDGPKAYYSSRPCAELSDEKIEKVDSAYFEDSATVFSDSLESR